MTEFKETHPKFFNIQEKCQDTSGVPNSLPEKVKASQRQKPQKSIVSDKRNIVETTSNMTPKDNNILEVGHNSGNDLTVPREDTVITPMVYEFSRFEFFA